MTIKSTYLMHWIGSAIAALGIAAIMLLLSIGTVYADVKIISSPKTVTALPGQRVSFTVQAESNRSIRHIWYRNNQQINMANSKTLTITASEASAAVTYRCVVNDGKSKAYCPDFRIILVTPSKPLDVLITYTAPFARENGVALRADEITGFKLWLVEGTTSAPTYTKLAEMPPSARSIQLTGLERKTYRFAITATDILGMTSKMSDVITVVPD